VGGEKGCQSAWWICLITYPDSCLPLFSNWNISITPAQLELPSCILDSLMRESRVWLLDGRWERSPPESSKTHVAWSSRSGGRFIVIFRYREGRSVDDGPARLQEEIYLYPTFLMKTPINRFPFFTFLMPSTTGTAASSRLPCIPVYTSLGTQSLPTSFVLGISNFMGSKVCHSQRAICYIWWLCKASHEISRWSLYSSSSL